MNLPSVFSVWRVALAFALAALLSVTTLAENKEKRDNSPQSNSNAQEDQSNKKSDSPSNDSQQSQNDKQPSSESEGKQKASEQNPQPQNNSNNKPGTPDAANNSNQPQNNAGGQSNSRRGSNNTTENQAPSRDTDNNTGRPNQSRDRQSEQQSNGQNAATRNANDPSRDNSRQPVNRDFRSDFKFGPAGTRGLTIANIVRDSIFYRSGLRDRDIIISYGGRPIRNQDDFARFVVYRPGQRVPVLILRDGREETIYVVYEQENVALAPGNARNNFGADFDPQSTGGAVVIRVQAGSPAHKAGLMQNDIVVALNGEQVSSGSDAIQVVNSLAAGQRLEVEYTRHARVEVVLAANNRDTNIDTATYQSTDRRAPVQVGVGTDETRRIESEGNRDNSNSGDRDRRDNRREGRGILPRLRN